ncbi:uncharacterized protein ACBR49_017536 isoform 2-T2 [Aulostomus maculatus]
MAGRSSSPAGREDTGTYAQLEEEEEQQRALPVSHVFLMSQPGQPGPYRLATICLATLCGILLISIIAVTAHHKNRPQGDAEGSEQQTQETDVLALTASLRKLQQENVLLRREKDELQAKLAARTVTKAPDGIRLMTKAPAAATVAASPAVCLTDWLVFNNSCYFISRFSRDWLESQSYCQSRGAHLAIIHTAEEQFLGGRRAQQPHRRGLRLHCEDTSDGASGHTELVRRPLHHALALHL